MEYGEGVVLYFMFLKYMIVLFFLLSLLSIPAMVFFFKGNAADLSEYTDVKFSLAAFSLGNIGQSKFIFRHGPNTIYR